MKIKAFTLATTWLLATAAAFAEEPYRTEVQIIGKESGPYKIGAKVQPKKRPYRMDPSRNITNEDLVRVIDALHPVQDPIVRDVIAGKTQKALEDLDKAASVGAHPHTTATIQDTVEEIDADPIETAGYEMSDEDYRNLDANISRARADMQNALDRMNATDEQARQQAIRDYEGAKQRLEQATSAAP